uniref:HTH CENPB-type domain-containing protein n=1 Tax=Pelodiscus sinensis TaxID=13735 RepID=K7G812_PELSI
RKSYTADFKLYVVTYSKDNGNRAAGRKYSMNEKSVWEWRKEEAELENLHPRKRAQRGKKAKWPNLEENLLKWICEHRCYEDMDREQKGGANGSHTIQAMEQKIYDFKGGSGNWVYKFMWRNNLSVHAQTSAGQWLPDEWEKKMDDFKTFDELGLQPSNVINMDVVPMSFDIPATWSVVETGTKTVCVATTSHERTCFTVVLPCMANGDKLKPMVIFKRVTMPREKLLAGVCVVCKTSALMTGGCYTDCFRSRFHNRPSSGPKSLLVLDSLAAHKDTSVQKHINSMGAHIAIIPGGLTSKLQLLDVTVNHPFTCFIREEWDNWMTNGEHTFTPAGRQRRATYVEVCRWVLAAWDRIKLATILNGFRKCDILPDSESDYD